MSRPFLPRFLSIFLPLALIVVLGSASIYRAGVGELTEKIGNQEQINVAVGANSLDHSIDKPVRDTLYLASKQSLAAAIHDTNPQTMADLARSLAIFSRSQRIYDKIRWIDETGMEKVRINYTPAGPVVVPSSELQDKSERYFFTEAIKLGAGEIYVSPLDLNVERGQIEVPYKPTIRIGTPVFDSRGKNRGIILLNYYGNELLAHFTETTSAAAGHTMLLNGEGYWLKSPKPEDEWGFMFQRSETLATRYPQAWQRIAATDRGQFEDAAGLWSFRTSYPLKSVTHHLAGERTYHWKVVALLPAEQLATPRMVLAWQLGSGALVVLAMLFVGTWQLVRNWMGRKAARKESKLYLHRLEGIVTERNDALARQNTIVNHIVRHAPLTETLTMLLRSIEQRHPDMICSILLLDAAGTRLWYGAQTSQDRKSTRLNSSHSQ